MLKNKKLKHILSVLVLFLAFFICGNVKAASVECVYHSSSGSEQVNVTISDYYDNGTFYMYNTSVKYLTWQGGNVNKTAKIKDFQAELWDLWIYREKKCPPYLYGSADDGTGFLNVKNTADAFFRLTSNFSYTYSDDELKENAKMLSLDESLSSASSAFSQLRRPRALSFAQPAFQYTYGYDVGASSLAYNKNTFSEMPLYAETITMKTGQYARIYVRSMTEYARDGGDFTDATITCTSSNPTALEISDAPNKIIWTGAPSSYPHQNYSYHDPGFHFEVKAKQVMNNIMIECTAKNPDGSYVINAEATPIFVHVSEGTPTQTTFEKDKINCYYKLQSTDKNGNKYDITDAKISIGNYKDGTIEQDNTNNQMQVSFSYMNTSNSFLTTTKGKDINNYKYYATSSNNQRKLVFDFGYTDFTTYFKYNNNTCPALYIKKSSNKYKLQLSSSSGNEEAFLYKTETKGTNDTSFKTENYTMADKTFSLPVYFYTSEPIDVSDPHLTGALTFRLQENNLIYDLDITQKNGTLKNISRNTMILSDTQRSDILTNQYGNGDYNSYTYYVRLEPSFLQSVKKFLNGTISEVPAANTLSDRVHVQGFQYNEYYTVSLNEIVPEGNDYSEVVETDQYFEGTREDTGVTPDAITNAVANIGSFNIGSSGSNQTPEQFCSSLLGNPGSRNGVGKIVENILTLIRIGVPILLIITSMVDFTKATGKDDEMVKAKKNAVTRFLVAVAVLFAPSLINLVLGLLGWDSCAIF